MSFFQKIKDSIFKSIKDHTGKDSSSRISSYFILGSILLTSIVYLSIDIANAIISYKSGTPYAIPSEHIFIFSLILTHHLILLGLKKSAESTPFPGLKDKEEDKTKLITDAKKKESGE